MGEKAGVLPAMQPPSGPSRAELTSKTKDFPYWCCRGKVYDLSKFEHPGGPVALQLAKNRDCDDLIRSYHPFNEEKVRQILAKYEVQGVECPYPPANVYDNEDSAFAKDLKAGVMNYFAETKQDRTANLARWRDYGIMLSLVLVSTYFLVQGYWLAVPICPVFWWIFGVNTFHDSSHFAITHNWRLNHYSTHLFPFFSSPTTWYYQHVVGHHPYVNIRGKDPDLNHQSPLHRYAPWHRFKKLHAYQAYGIWLVWCLGVTLQGQLTDLVCFSREIYQNVVPMERMSQRRKYLHWFGRVFAFSMVHVWPFFTGFPLWKAFLFSILPNYVLSILYLSVSQAGHIVAETMTLPNRDFYKHQIAHTHNFGTDSLITFWVSGGLNLQVEHHLFPGLNHCHLRALAPMVKEVCKKHGVVYHESSGYLAAVYRHLQLIWALSVR